MLFNRKNNYKIWAEQNSLNYRKKAEMGFFRLENISIVDLVWGEYLKKRLYLFTVIDCTCHRGATERYTYFNGNFYSKIEVEKNGIERLLQNENSFEQVLNVFGNEIEEEIIQVLVAQVYLQSGIIAEFKTIKETYKLLWKFYKSKTGVKDELIGYLADISKADIEFNSLEASSFVKEKSGGKIDDLVIQEVANAHEKLLRIYNTRKP